MPWNPKLKCYDINTDSIRKITSTTNPWLVPLKILDKFNNSKCMYILIKNIDLRKDKLTMYISKWLNLICNNNVHINTYNILPYEYNYGWIEIIENTKTLYDINILEQTTLKKYIIKRNPNQNFNYLCKNFIKTCVSSSVLCYILGLGDRHLENILINENFELIHIDFSYIMGDDPKNANVEMKITPDMLDMLGGKNSSYFQIFKLNCSKAYKEIRSRSSLWFILLMFLAFNKPDIIPYNNNYEFIKKYIIDRLVPGEFDDESSSQIIEIIERSSNESLVEKLSDFSHYTANNIKGLLSYIPQFKVDSY